MKTEIIKTRVSKEIKQKLIAICKELGMSESEYIRYLIIRNIENRQ